MTAAVLPRMESHDRLARIVLRADGVFCMTLGAAMLVAERPVAALLGVGNPVVVAVVGVAAAAYGAWLAFGLSRRTPLPRQAVMAVAVADAIWVVASVAELVAGVPAFTTEGRWVVAALALVVAAFGVAQSRSLKEMDRGA